MKELLEMLIGPFMVFAALGLMWLFSSIMNPPDHSPGYFEEYMWGEMDDDEKKDK